MRAQRRHFNQLQRFFSAQAQSKRHQPPSVLYKELVDNGLIKEDKLQIEACRELDRVYLEVVERIEAGKNGVKGKTVKNETPQSGWKSWFSRKSAEPVKPKSATPGLFLYGLGGAGKTFLMDLMYDSIPSNKYRAHFHSFILEAHDRLHRQRMEKGTVDMKQIAADIVEESDVNVFCFDELNPLDIGDAMALKLLFEGLVENGATIVTTTKLPPDDVYKNGRSRDLFLPCIELLKDNCVIHHLDNDENYRMHADLEGDRYVTPNGPEANAYLDKKFEDLSRGMKNAPWIIEVAGSNRGITIPKGAGTVADFTYSELFDNPTGASDYYAIAANFRSLIIRDVREITFDDLGVAKRFLTFLDIMYDHKVQCYFSSEKPALQLFDQKVLQNSIEHCLRLEDILSRLCDMQSHGYRRSKYRVPQMKKIATPIAFKDLDGSGVLDIDEFIDLCNSLGMSGSREEMEAIFKESDEDGNGTLDVDEVERMLMSRLTFKLMKMDGKLN